MGYTVDAALSKQVAINFALNQDYDLIVLDVNLPDGNGFNFCREAKERHPNTAVIFLTANDMESDMLKGYELGIEVIHVSIAWTNIYCCCKTAIPVSGISGAFSFSRIFSSR